MSIFKKKPQKKRKVASLTKKVVASQTPQQWIPPFPWVGMRQKVKPVDHTNQIPEVPKLVNIKPTYILPQAPKIVDPVVPNHDEPEKRVRPREQKARKEFLKTFSQLTHRWRSWDIWTDFVTMAACAISNAVDKTHFDEREATYLRIINKYSKEEQQLFPELFAHLVIALEETPEQDFLGEVYTELGLNSKEHQQIFTPYYIAYMMAMIAIDDVEKEVHEKGFVTVHDCCCGGGVTLIAAAHVIKEKLDQVGLNFQYHTIVTGQDIDPVVVMMCYIQLSLLGIAGYFKVGDFPH